MKNCKVLDRIEQTHGAKINRLVWIAASRENRILSDILEDMADSDGLHEVFPEISENEVFHDYAFDHFEMMVEYQKLGFLAEVFFPLLNSFEFNEDGHPTSYSYSDACGVLRYVYAETTDELLSKIEQLSEEHYNESVKKARR